MGRVLLNSFKNFKHFMMLNSEVKSKLGETFEKVNIYDLPGTGYLTEITVGIKITVYSNRIFSCQGLV